MTHLVVNTILAVMSVFSGLGLVWADASGGTAVLRVSCGEDPCREPADILFLHAASGQEVGRVMVQPGVAGEIPRTVEAAIALNGWSRADISIVVAGDDFVSTEARLDEFIDSGAELRLWRASALEARVRSTGRRGDGSINGGAATVFFWPADGSGGLLPTFRTTCPLEDARLKCKVPEGTWDLRLQLRGYAPITRWAQTFMRARVRDLGALELQPGAAVKGLLVVTGVEIPDLTTEAAIEIVPTEVVRQSLPHEKMRRLRALRSTVKPLKDGAFGFDDLATGTFIIKAMVANVGESEARKFTVDGPVASNLSSPLVVSPPIRAYLRTGMVLDEGGLPLIADLEVLRAEHEADRVTLSFPLESSGMTPLPPLIAGDYLLMIHSAGGANYFRDVVTIDHDTQVIEVGIRQVPVLGRVVLGDEPVTSAHLEFSGQEGEEVPATSDDDGQFSLVLPSEGRWLVAITAERPRISRAFTEVDVLAGAPVLINLEKTGVRVTVKGATLSPVPSARVMVISAYPYSVATETDDEGVAEVIGLPPGEYLVQAFDETSQSLLEVIEVEGTEFVEVELPLQTTASEIRGRLIDREGRPVGYASGIVLSRDASGDPVTLSTPVFTTDAEGQFAARVPLNAAFYRVGVAVDGHDLFLSDDCVVTGDAGDITTFRIGRSSGGIIELQLPKTDSKSSYPFLVINGIAAPLGWIRQGPNVVDSTIDEDGNVVVTVTDMPAGTYKLCRADVLHYLRAISGSEISDPECAEGYLAFGSRLRLEGVE
jgi:hypothetical protein